jgi:hypothetical protein
LAGHDGGVPDPNRVTPFGAITALDQRGTFMGNRGVLPGADGARRIARPWQVRRWITCVLEHKGWVAPRWKPGRWTALFFWDEAVALAAGHRPCALCRRPDFERWCDAWESAFGERQRVDPMDRRLHADRVDADSCGQLRHTRPWDDLPDGTFVLVPGEGEGEGEGETPALVRGDRLVPWTTGGDGYGVPIARPGPGSEHAVVLTPRATVEVLTSGYEPALHPSLPQ